MASRTRKFTAAKVTVSPQQESVYTDAQKALGLPAMQYSFDMEQVEHERYEFGIDIPDSRYL